MQYAQLSRVTVAYGRQPVERIGLGSLDLLDAEGKLELLLITAKAAEALCEAEIEPWKALPHASFDLVIMNPPFVRATRCQVPTHGARASLMLFSPSLGR